MTQAHRYKETKGRYFIDGKHVSKVDFQDSKGRSVRIKEQFRYANGTIGARLEPEAKKVQREIKEEFEAPVTHRYLVRGIARPRSKTDARTPELESDHILETDVPINSISDQENRLNEKYPDWVHFDTYLEEIA